MIRLLGLSCLFAACTLCGISRAAELRTGVRLLRLLENLLQDMAAVLRYQTPTVWELTAQLAAQPQYQPLTFLRQLQREARFCEVWAQAVAEERTFDAETRLLLTEFGYTLGTTDTAGQLAAIALYTERLHQLLRAAEVRCTEKGKLFRAVGMLGGAAAVVLLA